MPHYLRRYFVGGAGAVFVLIFKAVPDTRVVAGGNDDGAAGLLRQDPVADDGSRRGFRRKIYFNAVSGDYLRGGRSEVFGGKAGIVADDQPAFGQFRFF